MYIFQKYTNILLCEYEETKQYFDSGNGYLDNLSKIQKEDLLKYDEKDIL